MRTVELCVICQYRTPDRAMVCDGCRRRMEADLVDLVEEWTKLDPAPGQGSGERITGTREKPLPARVTVLDLTISNIMVKAVNDPYRDQAGHIPVVAILDGWARDWAEELRQMLPAPTVPNLARWLALRIDWACDTHPAIDEYVAEIRSTLATCRAVNGITVDTIPIGPCATARDDGNECGYRLRADPYLDNITCRRCQTVWPKRNWLWLHDREKPVELDLEAHAC